MVARLWFGGFRTDGDTTCLFVCLFVFVHDCFPFWIGFFVGGYKSFFFQMDQVGLFMGFQLLRKNDKDSNRAIENRTEALFLSISV